MWFGFVHFARKSEAMKAIENVNGLVIRGRNASVKEAQYRRKGRWNTKTKPTKKIDYMKPKDTNQWWNGVDGRLFKEVVLQRDGNRGNHNAKEQKNL